MRAVIAILIGIAALGSAPLPPPLKRIGASKAYDEAQRKCVTIRGA